MVRSIAHFPNKNDAILFQSNLENEENAYTFSALVKEAAITLGFSSFKASLIALGASEIAINAIRYANGATAYVEKTSNNKGLCVHIQDRGPGIDNLSQAMTQGFSTYNSLGLGLGAAKRASDDMYIDTGLSGTLIRLTSYLPIENTLIDIGSVSFPQVNKYYNHNGYCIKKYHGENILAAVFNSLEEGQNLESTLILVSTFIKENYELPLKDLIKQIHMLLQDKSLIKGMDMGMLRITPEKIESLIIGNITVETISPIHNSTVQLVGSLGKKLPLNITPNIEKNNGPLTLALYSSGIKNTLLPEEAIKDSYAIKHAEGIFDAHALADDDATIIVVKSYG